MKVCKFCNNISFMNTPTCNVDNKKCSMMKRCVDERRWKPLSEMPNCAKNPENHIPDGYLRVCMKCEDKIYVENGEFIEILPYTGVDIIAVKLNDGGDIIGTY